MSAHQPLQNVSLIISAGWLARGDAENLAQLCKSQEKRKK